MRAWYYDFDDAIAGALKKKFGVQLEKPVVIFECLRLFSASLFTTGLSGSCNEYIHVLSKGHGSYAGGT